MSIVILLLVLLIWFWFEIFRAQEAVKAMGKKICSQFHLQLLDDTVTLTRMRLMRDDLGRWNWQRTYVFEFSDSGNNRKQGVIVIRGLAMEMLELPGYLDRIISPV
jgi:Protein of unknown function (DUF3301)